VCDEYQQICSAGDAQFFDTSRALGVIGIVASQSIEADIAAIGNEHAATASSAISPTSSRSARLSAQWSISRVNSAT